METRIRTVWILSLLSALLLIAIQGYWLYNQYMYTIDSYSEEVATGLLQASEKEFLLRKEEKPLPYSVMVNKNSTYGPEESNDAIKNAVAVLLARVDSLENNQDTTVLRFSFNPNLSGDSLYAAINRSVIETSNPFRIERFDSIIATTFPNLNYTLTLSEPKDSIFNSGWKKRSHLFQPDITVYYAYDPLKYKGVYIHATIASHPIFQRMAIQLILALGLILVSIGCLIFQIKTILKQQKLNELRQHFVHTMIHELKRPVQTLKTFVAFLKDKKMREDEHITEEVLQDSMFELDNLSAYLNKLKDLVQVDNEKTPLHISRFNLQGLTEKVIRLAHIPAEKKVVFHTSFQMDSPVISADPIHIANVLSNLIENAVKYSEKEVEITIEAKVRQQELQLTVSDNGIGIPLAEQHKVFGKFFRGSNLPDKNIPGIGLGLSYVQLISQAHQGYVSLQSHIGQGTSISLFIPQYT